MTGRRDDIVMRPRLDASQRATNAKGRQKEARQIQLMDKGAKGLRGKLAAARAARAVAKRRQRNQHRKKLVRAQGRSRLLMSGASKGARTPWGMIVAAVGMAGIIATKLATGRTFGQMAIDAKRKLIGDQDLEAAAASGARRTLTGNNLLMRSYASGGTSRAHMNRIFEWNRKDNLRYLKGRQVIEQAIGVNSLADDFVDTRFANISKDIRAALGEDSMVLTAIRDFAQEFRASYKANIIDKPR